MGARHYGRYQVEISNEDKILFPDAGLTKGDLVDYHERIAEHMLPHLESRALVVQRFPDGIEEEGFYQKQVADHSPRWISTTRVNVESTDGTQELVVCDKAATLAFLSNEACITLHPWLSRTTRIHHPDTLIVDLDPPDGEFGAARRAALRVHALFEELGLVSYAKLTGSKGVHVHVPLNRRTEFDAVRGFAREAMDLLAARHDRELTTEHRIRRRAGRLYLDVGRNAYGQTAVAPWSVRPLPGAPVAAPVAWRELERDAVGPRDYTVENVFRRIGQRTDPWHGMRRRARSLDRARARLHRLREGEE
jgi:bifunctional non-homologous end joining protein LigD